MIDDLKWRVQNWLFARRNSECHVERPCNIAGCTSCPSRSSELTCKGHNFSSLQHAVDRMPTILLSYIDTMSRGAVRESQLPLH